MNKQDKNLPIRPDVVGDLFSRVVSIIDRAQSNVVNTVNSNMVLAYWLIGREIVQELQRGEERAKYGQQVITELSSRLTDKFGKGFSAQSLWNFRRFYQVYVNRLEVLMSPDSEHQDGRKHSPPGSEFIGGMTPFQSERGLISAFSPQLSWSHYRSLMRVRSDKSRAFYEREAIECGWSKAQLERQIQSSYYQRILANQGESGSINPKGERLPGDPLPAGTMLKSPYILEFLGLSDTPDLHENDLEQAIIDNLQNFLLELGKGFSFVARQKHIRLDDGDFYIDLVFYNYMLKCFLLVDLKIGKLTHRDVGQMDGYVRLFEDNFKMPEDNSTIGLILCSDKSEAVAKYSVLNESRQIFASKYLQFLPSEQELVSEIKKERRMIEASLEEKKDNEQN
ncbi:MAG: PDDEXK nuclease domain-containing protein [Pseudohongiellaceae bacterium]